MTTVSERPCGDRRFWLKIKVLTVCGSVQRLKAFLPQPCVQTDGVRVSPVGRDGQDSDASGLRSNRRRITAWPTSRANRKFVTA